MASARVGYAIVCQGTRGRTAQRQYALPHSITTRQIIHVVWHVLRGPTRMSTQGLAWNAIQSVRNVSMSPQYAALVTQQLIIPKFFTMVSVTLNVLLVHFKQMTFVMTVTRQLHVAVLVTSLRQIVRRVRLERFSAVLWVERVGPPVQILRTSWRKELIGGVLIPVRITWFWVQMLSTVRSVFVFYALKVSSSGSAIVHAILTVRLVSIQTQSSVFANNAILHANTATAVTPKTAQNADLTQQSSTSC